ncbi:MAG: hypothetical protein AB1814_11955 [Thermodesulfobacteriota bacterium]
MVKVLAPCLDCGEPISVEMRDGQILKAEPAGLVGYVAVPLWQWRQDIPFA